MNKNTKFVISNYNLRNIKGRDRFIDNINKKKDIRRVSFTNKNRTKIISNLRKIKSPLPDIDIWDNVNKFERADGFEIEYDKNNNIVIEDNEWVSGTKPKNYFLNDTFLDWAKLYYPNGIIINKPYGKIKDESGRSFTHAKSNNNNQLNPLFDMGHKFENDVINYIKNKFEGLVVSICLNYQDIKQENMNNTINSMMLGVPFIDQAVLYNNKNGTFGVADLLVRSDYINKLITTPVLSTSEETLKASNLNGNYHYVVIDIKWSKMELCANGINIRNVRLYKPYKAQLAIYNSAMGNIQGYTPDKAYILAKSWSYKKKGRDYYGYNCLSRLGHIDYAGFDCEILEQLPSAIRWNRNVVYNGHTWNLTDKMIPQLYPNMCNTYDGFSRKIKQIVAEKLDELTLIWNVNHKHRKNGHENSIFKYTDENCTAESMGIKGKKVGPIVNKILEINKHSCGDLIRPQIIQNNYMDWQNKKDIEFFLDFEGLNKTLYEKTIDINNSGGNPSMIFMVGIGYIEYNTWNYKSFYMNNCAEQEETRIMNEFVNFVNDRIQLHMDMYEIQDRTLCVPHVYHWGNAENTMFNHANKKNNYIWNSWKQNMVWIDLCNIFKSEPIVIKGAKNFGLKEITKYMHQHNMIKSYWKINEVNGGFGAMVGATTYYIKKDLNKQNDKEFKKIIDYNEIDCKVLWEILEYLRNNLCNKE